MTPGGADYPRFLPFTTLQLYQRLVCMNFHNFFRSPSFCCKFFRYKSLRSSASHKSIRNMLGRVLVVALFTVPGVIAYADTALGTFTGGPADTWDGLKQSGIQVRTFEQ